MVNVSYQYFYLDSGGKFLIQQALNAQCYLWVNHACLLSWNQDKYLQNIFCSDISGTIKYMSFNSDANDLMFWSIFE